MGRGFLASKIQKYKAGINHVGASGLPMRFRLFGFFLVFTTLIMLGVLALLFASGIFVSGHKESRAYFEQELKNTSDKISQDYASITVYAVELANKLSGNLERAMH